MDKNVKNWGNCLVEFLLFWLCFQKYKTGMEYKKCVNLQLGVSWKKNCNTLNKLALIELTLHILRSKRSKNKVKKVAWVINHFFPTYHCILIKKLDCLYLYAKKHLFAPVLHYLAPVNSKQKHRQKIVNHGCQTTFGEATTFNKCDFFTKYGKGTVLFLSVASRHFRFVSLHHLLTKN